MAKSQVNDVATNASLTPPASGTDPKADVKIEITKWTCQISHLDARGQPAALVDDANPVTVGDKFLLACQGPPVQLDAQSLALMLPKNAKYALRLLGVRSLTEERGEFVATTWVGGKVEFKQLYLTDGKARIDLGPLAIDSKSVIPQEKAQEAKPFDPWGPAKLALPDYVFVVIASVIALIAIWASLVTIRIVRRRRFLALLAKDQIAMTPFHQFNKDLRQLIRKSSGDPASFIAQLDESFRWYLARELSVPTLNRKTPAILKDIRRRHPDVFKQLKRDLSLTLSELQKASASSGRPVQDEDAHQIADLCRTLADRIQTVRSGLSISGSGGRIS